MSVERSRLRPFRSATLRRPLLVCVSSRYSSVIRSFTLGQQQGTLQPLVFQCQKLLGGQDQHIVPALADSLGQGADAVQGRLVHVSDHPARPRRWS